MPRIWVKVNSAGPVDVVGDGDGVRGRHLVDLPLPYGISAATAVLGAAMLAAYAFKRRRLLKLLGVSTILAGLISCELTYLFEFLLKEIAAELTIPP